MKKTYPNTFTLEMIDEIIDKNPSVWNELIGGGLYRTSVNGTEIITGASGAADLNKALDKALKNKYIMGIDPYEK